MVAWREATISLLAKWSGHAGPRPMHISVRPPQVLWLRSHRISAGAQSSPHHIITVTVSGTPILASDVLIIYHEQHETYAAARYLHSNK